MVAPVSSLRRLGLEIFALRAVEVGEHSRPIDDVAPPLLLLESPAPRLLQVGVLSLKYPQLAAATHFLGDFGEIVTVD